MAEQEHTPTEAEVASWYAHGRARVVFRPASQLEAEVARTFAEVRADERAKRPDREQIALLSKIREMHQVEPSMRCAARTTLTVGHSNTREETPSEVVCSKEAGHEGSHKDEVCCWRFHEFPADSAEPQPVDISQGNSCSCGRWKCPTAAVLSSLAPEPEARGVADAEAEAHEHDWQGWHDWYEVCTDCPEAAESDGNHYRRAAREVSSADS